MNLYFFVLTKLLQNDEIYSPINPLINPEIKNKDIIFYGTKQRIFFLDEINIDDSIQSIIKHFIKYGNYYSLLPINLCAQLCGYASNQGLLSHYIQKNFMNIYYNIQYI